MTYSSLLPGQHPGDVLAQVRQIHCSGRAAVVDGEAVSVEQAEIIVGAYDRSEAAMKEACARLSIRDLLWLARG